MKKFNVVIIACCFIFNSYGQASIVTAPTLEIMTQTNTGIQKSMAVTMAKLEAKQQILDKALQTATWLKNLETAKRLLHMVQTLVCNGREFNKAISAGHHDCFVDFEFEMVITKIQMSADYLGIILAANRMTTGERMKTLNDVLERFEEAQKGMNGLVKDLKEEKETQQMMDDLNADHPSGVRFRAKKN